MLVIYEQYGKGRLMFKVSIVDHQNWNFHFNFTLAYSVCCTSTAISVTHTLLWEQNIIACFFKTDFEMHGFHYKMCTDALYAAGSCETFSWVWS